MCGVLNRLLTDEAFRDEVVTCCMERCECMERPHDPRPEERPPKEPK